MSLLRDRLAEHKGEILLELAKTDPDSGFWLTPFTVDQLEEWWRAQETFDSNPGGALDVLYEVFGEVPPPHSERVCPGELIIADNEEAIKLWDELYESGRHYICNLCCDHDSYLRRPDGSYILHRGFKGLEKPGERL